MQIHLAERHRWRKSALFKQSRAPRCGSVCHFVHLLYQLEVRPSRYIVLISKDSLTSFHCCHRCSPVLRFVPAVCRRQIFAVQDGLFAFK